MPRSKAQKIAAGKYRSPKRSKAKALHEEGMNGKHAPQYITFRAAMVKEKIDTMRRELAAIGVEHPKKEEPCTSLTADAVSES